MQTFIFLGAPGVGKGTMAEAICADSGLLQLSTGQVLRDEIAKGTDLGNTVKECVEKGEYAPDKIVVQIVANYIKDNMETAKGVILDGFPRTLNQAECLSTTLGELELDLTGTILLEAGEETILGRLTGRRMCKECGAIFHMLFMLPKVEGVCDKCGGELYQRADDCEETVRNRLKVYAEQTQPLISYYDDKGQLTRVDADCDREENIARLKKVMSTFA